jgi:hypothetical protein
MGFEAIIGLVLGALVMISVLVASVAGNVKQRGQIKRLKERALQDSADREAEHDIDGETRDNVDSINNVRRLPDGPAKLARAISESRAARARAKAELERRFGLQLGPDDPGNE